VYGLQSKGLDGTTTFSTSIEDMAEDYLKEIKRLQPEGPYMLGGYCMGGTLAYETAQRLHRNGDKIALVALFETYNFSKIGKKSIFKQLHFYYQKILFHFLNFYILDTRNKWRFIKEKSLVAYARKDVWLGSVLCKFGFCSNGQNRNSILLSTLWDTNDNAVITYQPKEFPGSVIQFIPKNDYAHHKSPDLNWDSLVQGGVEKHVIDVYPAGMLVEPFVKSTAEILNGCLHRTYKTISTSNE
jgi:thioesterase domain-containing protein